MDLLLKSVTIIDPNAKQHLKAADILIRSGKLEKIGNKLEVKGKVKVIEGKGLHVSPGWFDMRVNFMDPGFEYKEDIQSGLNAAAQGGFTGVLVMPSTDPVIQSKSGVEYIRKKAAGHIVDAFVSGALSVGMQGKEITEMYDMTEAGAIAFTDDKKIVSDPSLMLKALMYCGDLPAIIMAHPSDEKLTRGSVIHEGKISAQTGLSGSPVIAETLMISRDLELNDYAETQLHFSGISSSKGAELIRKAKKAKAKISADVAAHQLFFSDEELSGFDSLYKLQPPLRSESDRKALIKALADGTIDIICSDHTPQDKESKDLEFEYACNGMIASESFFGLVNTALKEKMDLTSIIRTFCQAPRELLNLKTPVIAEGEEANLTIFNPNLQWTFSWEHICSRSQNTPVIGRSLTGKAIAVVNRNQVSICK